MPGSRALPVLLGAFILAEVLLLALGPDYFEARRELAATGGAQPSWEADADMGIHIAAWVNLGLLALLFLTQRWWSRPFHDASAGIPQPAARTPRWFWPGVLVTAILCLGLRLPLASKSLWWDECWSVRQCSHGRWQPDKKTDALKFSPTSWKRCAFYYQKPTNHVPMSLAQKASLTLWRGVTGAAKHEFSDLAARVPALLASAAAIVLLASLGRAWGRPGVGLLAALLLALHPWHIRHGVDARAYALVVPLCVSALLASWRITQAGGRRTRDWAWLGLNQFLWLWAYPNALLDVLALFTVLAFLLWRAHSHRADRFAALSRLIACHLAAAMLLLQMFLPCFMQARHWAGQEPDKHLLTAELARETASLLMLGTSLRASGNPFPKTATDGGPYQVADSPGLPAGPVMAIVLWIPALLLAIAGLWAMRLELGRSVWLVWALALSALVFASITRLADSYFYPRFVIALVPVAMLGLAWNARQIGLFSTPARTLFASLPIVAGFLVATTPERQRFLTIPISPLRDVADFVSKRATPGQRPLVACYGLGREAMPVYYPEMENAVSKAEVEALIARAKNEARELLLIQGYSGFNRTMLPDGFVLMDDPSKFETLATFPGIEPDFFFRVLRAR